MRALKEHWTAFHFVWHRWRSRRAAKALAVHVSVATEILENRRVEKVRVNIDLKMEGDE